MHPFSMPKQFVERVVARSGRVHPFDVLDPARTALLVIDMQNYFVKPDFLGAVPMAREIVPSINRLAAELRSRGGHVIWVKNSTSGTLESWSVLNDCLMTPKRRDLRYETMDESHEGHKIWSAMDTRPEDAQIVKKRYSAFIQGSSDIERHLRERNIDTVLIAGTATNVCCESTARDAMMLNFKTVMISDALATYTDQEHHAALSNFYVTFGDIQTVNEAIASLDASSAQVKKP